MIVVSCNLTILLILLISVFMFTFKYTWKNKRPHLWSTSSLGRIKNSLGPKIVSGLKVGPFIIKTLKTAVFFSLISVVLSTYSRFNITKIVFSFWLRKTSLKVSLNFLYDQYFLNFVAVALIVTWSIMEFSYYYMSDDPKRTAFFRLLTIFLLKMLLLTCAKSLFLIFLGWEGVGFLSFLLISWWTTRNDARSSAIEAVIYKRIGDIGLILFIALSVPLFKSWKLKEVLLFSRKSSYSKFLIFGLILAASGKSAQFGLHPWLPAAMEGPTPVSALLHRSTMVVAGVFILVRTRSIFSGHPQWQSFVLLLGRVTAIFAASTAVKQHDIKKIIAYSTTRQLGLMVTAVGIGYPLIAFFHICTHAFFKAMLFLCSGSVIHSLKDEQDLRKMSGLRQLLPVTSACLALGRLALMGTPFLSGFYSKDLILELTRVRITKTVAISLRMLATLLTAVYRFRIVNFCFLFNPSSFSLTSVKEEKSNLRKALLRLAIGTILAGWFFSNFIIDFPSLTLPLVAKSLPIIVTIAGTMRALIITVALTKFKTKEVFYRKLTLQWFFTDIAHTISSLGSLISSLQFSTRSLDRGWQEKVGPQGVATIATTPSQANQMLQKGLVKSYILSSFFLIAGTLLMVFIIQS